MTEKIEMRDFVSNGMNMEADMNYTIRTMQEEDYDRIFALWESIRGFRLRSIDDSREGVARFIRRNPTTSIVAEMDGRIVGTILCGHDGREGSFYHVCVAARCRKRGIGRAMATAAMLALQKEHINKVTLIAFKSNELGNDFWQEEGWRRREEINSYEFVLNRENIARFTR